MTNRLYPWGPDTALSSEFIHWVLTKTWDTTSSALHPHPHHHSHHLITMYWVLITTWDATNSAPASSYHHHPHHHHHYSLSSDHNMRYHEQWARIPRVTGSAVPSPVTATNSVLCSQLRRRKQTLELSFYVTMIELLNRVSMIWAKVQNSNIIYYCA